MIEFNLMWFPRDQKARTGVPKTKSLKRARLPASRWFCAISLHCSYVEPLPHQVKSVENTGLVDKSAGISPFRAALPLLEGSSR